jgi:hypothetical protein
VLLDVFRRGEKFCSGLLRLSATTYSYFNSYFCFLPIYLIVRCRFAKVQYEHTEGRMDTRAGSYGRRFQAKVGLVNLKVPQLRKATLETVIIECYCRLGFLLEEFLIHMYQAVESVL